MITQLSASTFLLAAITLPALAQDPAAKTTTTVAQGPVLVVKTPRPEIAVTMAMGFGHQEELPELPASGHYVLSLGGDKKLEVKTGSGDVGLVQVTAEPAALLETFAQQVEGGKAMFRGAMTMALQPQGFSPKDVAAMVDDVWAFPRQMQRLSLNVVGDPEAVATEGLEITLLMEPKADAPFAATIDGLKPCSQGAPVLPSGEKAALQMRGSLAPESLQKMFGPMLAFVSRMGVKDEEAQKKAAAIYGEFLKQYDGGFSAMFDLPFKGNILVGVLDGEATQKLVNSEEYLALAKNQTMGNRDLSVELTPGVFEHRGLKVMRTRLTNDGAPNPVMPDGTLDTYFVVAGSCFTMNMGGKEADAKAAFDQVLDKKLTRAPLADATVLDLAVDIKAIYAFAMEQQGITGAEAPDDMPAKATVSLGKRDKSLVLHVKVK